MEFNKSLRLVDLINDLVANGETSWVEFKHNNIEPQMIGTRVSAISNAARLAGQHTGYMVWGVNDGRRIVGTSYNPDEAKVGGQVFALWLAQHLSPSLAFQFHSVDHPTGRVILGRRLITP